MMKSVKPGIGGEAHWHRQILSDDQNSQCPAFTLMQVLRSSSSRLKAVESDMLPIFECIAREPKAQLHEPLSTRPLLRIFQWHDIARYPSANNAGPGL